MPHTLLVDTSNLVHRLYQVICPAGGGADREVSIINRQLERSVRKQQQDLKADLVVFALDVGKSFRHHRYDGYKRGRKEKDPALRAVLAGLPQLLRTLGFPAYSADNHEADDVICSLALRAWRQDWRVSIASSDHDLVQLLRPGIQLATHLQNRPMTHESAAERYPFPLERLPTYKALCGDKSDNIPKVPQLGPKKAEPLLRRFPNIQAAYDGILEVQPVTRGLLQGHDLNSLLFFEDLATLRDLGTELRRV